MHHGARPLKPDHRDYDLHKSFGSVAPASFPAEYLTDAKLNMPDQNADGLPYGCTDYAQAELADDIVRQLAYSARQLEAVTHASALGGLDIRSSLKAAKALAWITAFFNVQATRDLDFFDAIRLAMLSGAPEMRSVSWGCPWFSEWEQAAYPVDNRSGIMPNLKSLSISGIPWHNSAFVGWTTINGVSYLINKSWQGTHVGVGGYLYFPREVVNNVMRISGTCAFTATNIPLDPQDIRTISISTVQWVASLLRNLINFSYGAITKTLDRS